MKVYDLKKCQEYYTKKFPYMKEEDIEIMYDIGCECFLNFRYPFHIEINEIPEEELLKHPTWIFRFIQWYIESAGLTNVIGYSENSVSWKFDKAGIPQDLIDELVACVG